MPQLIKLGALGRVGGGTAPAMIPDALLTEAGEEIITEDGVVIIHEDTEP